MQTAKKWKQHRATCSHGIMFILDQLGLLSSLICILVGVLCVLWLEPYGVHIATVGHVPRGMPAPSLPLPSPLPSGHSLQQFLTTCFLTGLVGFILHINACTIGTPSVTSSANGRSQPRVQPDQELLALGMANMLSSFFGGFPVVGSLSRTAVAGASGEWWRNSNSHPI